MYCAPLRSGTLPPTSFVLVFTRSITIERGMLYPPMLATSDTRELSPARSAGVLSDTIDIDIDTPMAWKATLSPLFKPKEDSSLPFVSKYGNSWIYRQSTE